MTEEDRVRWDAKYSSDDASRDSEEPRIPEVFAPYKDRFPRAGFALDLACGRGSTSVWLATLGLEVWGVDVSPVALDCARRLAAKSEISGRCTFYLADLDQGLPSSPQAEVVFCHLFRDPRLYRPIIDRLQASGLLAIAVLSEVGAQPGPFRALPGELTAAFDELAVIADGEAEGRAWLLARK
jgi:SAM-dependent methyltransferase